jgi:putative flippase GtrA
MTMVRTLIACERDDRPVTLVRALYERFRQIIHEFAKFGVIGVIGLLITNVGYAVFHSKFGTGPLTATTIATVIATCVTYVGNRYWSFRHRERTSVPRETLIFFVLNGIGLLIQDAVVGFNYYVLNLSGNKLAEFLALNVGIALATVFRFWSYRKFVWAAPADGTGTPARPAAPVTPDQPLAARNGNGHYAPAQAAPGSIEHANGHDDVAERAARNGSYSHR